MLVDCHQCRARVDGNIKGTVQRDYDPAEQSEAEGFRVSLFSCPVCYEPILGYQNWAGEKRDWNGDHETVWSPARRVWPSPELMLSASIPAEIQTSLLEAQKCLTVAAYIASVAMTGRALEAIGRHFHTGGKPDKLMLGAGIDELHKNKIIDERLYEWSRALHLNRNLAAHASSEIFGQEDAEDLFNFASAICDYVFVLSDKFHKFKKRREPKVTKD